MDRSPWRTETSIELKRFEDGNQRRTTLASMASLWYRSSASMGSLLLLALARTNNRRHKRMRRPQVFLDCSERRTGSKNLTLREPRSDTQLPYARSQIRRICANSEGNGAMR